MKPAGQRAGKSGGESVAHGAGPKAPWWLAAVGLATAALIAACISDAVAWVGRPFAGFLFTDSRIVVSIGREAWREARLKTAEWAVVTAVDGRPVTTAAEVHEAVRATGGTGELTYTFRRGAELFRLAIPVRRFGYEDFAAVFAPMLAVGTWTIAAGAAFVARRPDAATTRALFGVCLVLGVMLVTGPDQYGPYRFTPLYFLSLALLPAAILCFTTTFPWQPRAWSGQVSRFATVVCAGLGAALILRRFDAAVFLPLLYLVYCAVANAALLYLGSLVAALAGAHPARPQIGLALAAILAASLGPLAVLVTYPLRVEPVSAVWLIAPLGLWPLLTGIAVLRLPPAAPGRIMP